MKMKLKRESRIEATLLLTLNLKVSFRSINPLVGLNEVT